MPGFRPKPRRQKRASEIPPLDHGRICHVRDAVLGAESMFYAPRKNDHGLPRDPFKAIVVPRPIGWFTSISAKGEINLAPYSFFNAVSERPPMVMFSSGGRKDTISFIEETKEFVCNFATFDLRD